MSRGPLSGIKVVEFGQNLAGPYCGQILTFLGAEVLKIERPEGDDARRGGPHSSMKMIHQPWRLSH